MVDSSGSERESTLLCGESSLISVPPVSPACLYSNSGKLLAPVDLLEKLRDVKVLVLHKKTNVEFLNLLDCIFNVDCGLYVSIVSDVLLNPPLYDLYDEYVMIANVYGSIRSSYPDLSCGSMLSELCYASHCSSVTGPCCN